MIKIGVDGRTLSVPNPGGAVRTGIELTRELGRQHSDVTVFGHSNISARLDSLTIDSYGYRRNSKALGMIWEQTTLPKRATDREIDVLYSPVAYCPLVPTPFPCAITIHDVSSLSGHSAGWYNRFERIMLPQMASRADLIFTVSEFSKSKICSKLNIPESKVQVVYNGVNELFFSEDTPTTNLNLPGSYFLYVGALSTRKNISGLLEAFRILHEDYNIDHKLVLIGPEDDPTNESDIDSKMIEPIGEDIIQLGYVTDEQLKEAYSNAEALVFPSYYEGFGMPPLESMACGTPVIASNRTAIPEILDEAPIYINPSNIDSIVDAMSNILSSPSLRQEHVNKGYKQASQYRWDHSADDLIKKLLNIAQK